MQNNLQQQAHHAGCSAWLSRRRHLTKIKESHVHGGSSTAALAAAVPASSTSTNNSAFYASIAERERTRLAMLYVLNQTSYLDH